MQYCSSLITLFRVVFKGRTLQSSRWDYKRENWAQKNFNSAAYSRSPFHWLPINQYQKTWWCSQPEVPSTQSSQNCSSYSIREDQPAPRSCHLLAHHMRREKSACLALPHTTGNWGIWGAGGEGETNRTPGSRLTSFVTCTISLSTLRTSTTPPDNWG